MAGKSTGPSHTPERNDTDDDTAARKARADRIRRQIEQIIAPAGPEPGQAAQPPPPGATGPTGAENPRDFIQRRMRELATSGEEPGAVEEDEPSPDDSPVR